MDRAERNKKDESPVGAGWPRWAKRLASLALVWHLTAIGIGALAPPPSSILQRQVADQFLPYYGLIDQGYTYRYYTPEPPPTPVVTALLKFADGRPETTVRIPNRSSAPRLVYQRELALANALWSDYDASKRGPTELRPGRWAASYARRLCRTTGASEVTLLIQLHLVPPPERFLEAEAENRPLDRDSDEFFTAPERIGVFACEGL